MRRLAPLAVLLSFPAAAADEAPARAAVDCYCTDTAGARVEMGEHVCLSVDGRSFTARCAMSLNVPIWRDTGEACLSG